MSEYRFETGSYPIWIEAESEEVALQKYLELFERNYNGKITKR